MQFGLLRSSCSTCSVASNPERGDHLACAARPQGEANCFRTTTTSGGTCAEQRFLRVVLSFVSGEELRGIQDQDYAFKQVGWV